LQKDREYKGEFRMSTLRPVAITARDLPDAWAQCVFKILEAGAARKRLVDQGSFEGEFRLEFDYVTAHVLFPGTRPLIPDIPPHLGIPNPVENMEKVDQYFARYLMSSKKEGNEQYTYGERMIEARTSAVSHIGREHTYFSADVPIAVNQIEEIISRYKQYGHGNNQLIIQVGQPCDIMLKDPPCLRHIDTRIEEGKLHFIIYFRSWDLWSGLPENLAGIQLMKEYMAGEIGVEDGEMIFSSKGLHLYGYTWEIAGLRRGLTEGEMAKLLKELREKQSAPPGMSA
jgi:thymidylate synthase